MLLRPDLAKCRPAPLLLVAKCSSPLHASQLGMQTIGQLLLSVALSAFLQAEATAWGADCDAASSGCASGRWTCERGCPSHGLRVHAFNFQYAHPQGACFEVVPRNQSSVHIDFDLWCKYPTASWCRTLECKQPVVGCDNMHGFGISHFAVLDTCTGSAWASDLVHEECAWSCTNLRPVVRCTFHFDPVGRYGFGGQLQGCWMSESCERGRTVVDATCRPAPGLADLPHSGRVVVEVSGEVMLAVAGGSHLASEGAFSAACRTGLSAVVPSVGLDAVRIDGVTAVRRRLADGDSPRRSVRVRYTVLADSQNAGAVAESLEAVDTEALACALNSQLASTSDAQPVIVTSVSTVTMTVPVAGEVQAAHSQLTAAVAASAQLEQHLTQARAELDATHEALRVQGEGNASVHEKLEAARTAHQVAQGLLGNVVAAHDAAQERLAAVASQNELVQSQLAKAQASDAQARERLAAALQQVQEAREQVARLNSTRGGQPAELAAARDVQLAAEQLAAEARAERAAALQRLAENVEESRRIAAELEAARRSRLAMEDSLAVAMAELGSVREELWAVNAAHGVTREQLRQQRLSLEEELTRHEETKAALAEEQLAHSRSREALGEERAAHSRTRDASRSERGALLATVVGLTLLVACLLALAICLLWRQRRFARSRPLPMGSGSDGTVVVGNPVNADVLPVHIEEGTVPKAVPMPPSTCKAACGPKAADPVGVRGGPCEETSLPGACMG